MRRPAVHTAAAIGVGKRTVAPTKVGQVKYRGTVNLASLPGTAGPSSGALRPRAGSPLRPKTVRNQAGVGPAANPNPSPDPLQAAPGTAFGFVGLTAATSGGLNGFDGEPPDQGLCAHSGAVLETVNSAVAVYTEAGITRKQPVSLNAFFGLPPAASTNGSTTTYGPFLSDPRCYYDAQTGRWFATALEIDTNPYTGALGFRSSEVIAVSQTSDPTGVYGLFSLDTTNDGSDGTFSQPNCPCLGDYPRIGADANGFYISADSYPISGSGNGNGGELFAFSKRALAAAVSGSVPPPFVVAIDNGAVIIHGYPANAVQPAETPEGAAYAADTEYFLSTPDFNGFVASGGAGASSLVQWTLTGTSSLGTSTPGLTLTDAILPSEPFTPPVPAAQKPGPLPFGGSLRAPPARISVNDDRMMQVEYVGGRLYSSLNTAVGSGAALRSGVAWFQVTTSGDRGTVGNQGYLAAGGGTSLLYPSIGLTRNGTGAMTFSVSGPANHPSAAYVPFNQGPRGAIDVTAPGALPEDGFTCYASAGFGPTCRWGDYTAASSDGAGHVVMGDEMIPNVARDPMANWGTFLTTLTP